MSICRYCKEPIEFVCEGCGKTICQSCQCQFGGEILCRNCYKKRETNYTICDWCGKKDKKSKIKYWGYCGEICESCFLDNFPEWHKKEDWE